jgi:hypothetical protein
VCYSEGHWCGWFSPRVACDREGESDMKTGKIVCDKYKIFQSGKHMVLQDIKTGVILYKYRLRNVNDIWHFEKECGKIIETDYFKPYTVVDYLRMFCHWVGTIWSGNSERSLIMRSVTKCILIGAIIGSVSGWFIGEWYVTPYLNQHFFISPITLEEGKQ